MRQRHIHIFIGKVKDAEADWTLKKLGKRHALAGEKKKTFTTMKEQGEYNEGYREGLAEKAKDADPSWIIRNEAAKGEIEQKGWKITEGAGWVVATKGGKQIGGDSYLDVKYKIHREANRWGPIGDLKAKDVDIPVNSMTIPELRQELVIGKEKGYMPGYMKQVAERLKDQEDWAQFHRNAYRRPTKAKDADLEAALAALEAAKRAVVIARPGLGAEQAALKYRAARAAYEAAGGRDRKMKDAIWEGHISTPKHPGGLMVSVRADRKDEAAALIKLQYPDAAFHSLKNLTGDRKAKDERYGVGTRVRIKEAFGGGFGIIKDVDKNDVYTVRRQSGETLKLNERDISTNW